MKTPTLEPNQRISLIDALRGSALMGILLVHSIEHWDFLRYPEHPPEWLNALNNYAHDIIFFLFSGKAYGVFAMMFGVSFFIILDRWSRRGISFRGRFLWRLALLAMFGYLNAIVYCGDILFIIAVLGVPLVFLYKLSDRALAWIAIALMLQIPSLWEAGRVLFEAGYRPAQPHHWALYGQLFDAFSNGTWLQVSALNAGKGQLARLWWTVETGRYTQMMGLMVAGLLIGRSRVFENPSRALRLAKHCLIWGAVGFVIFYPIKLHLGGWGLRGMRHYEVNNLVSAYCNLAQLAVWVGLFVMLYRWVHARAALDLLAPYGRMSLTCYVTQGMIGVPLFYGYGLALFHYLGPFYSSLVGAAIVTAQCVFAHLWLRGFVYGPLEWLWRSLTFLSLKTPMRKQIRQAEAVQLPAGAAL